MTSLFNVGKGDNRGGPGEEEKGRGRDGARAKERVEQAPEEGKDWMEGWDRKGGAAGG